MKRVLPPIVSLLLCFGLFRVVEFVDTNFMTRYTFLSVSVMLVLLTSIPIIIVLNIIYLLSKSSDDTYHYSSHVQDQLQPPRTPSWIEFRNYENLEKLRNIAERQNVDRNSDT